VSIRQPASLPLTQPVVEYRRQSPLAAWRLRSGALHIRWEELGEFLIDRQGRRILAQRAPEAYHGEYRDLLLSAILSFALLEQGLETLHASSVVFDGRAVAFAGRARSGKSTLAAFFARKGRAFLTDDLLALRRAGRRVEACPTVPQIKLEPEALRALGLNPRRFPLVVPGSAYTKRLWQLPTAKQPRPLAAVFFPRLSDSRRGRVRVAPMSRTEFFQELLGYSFNVVLVPRRRLRRQFALFSRMAKTIPARRLLIPRGLHRLEEVAERIERDLAEIPT
jgi:serine kinase of HPr protein (carbohydrate metabolism regulator)